MDANGELAVGKFHTLNIFKLCAILIGIVLLILRFLLPMVFKGLQHMFRAIGFNLPFAYLT